MEGPNDTEFYCPNCGNFTKGSDLFCSRCGQKKGSHKITLRSFLAEMLGGLFHMDSKFLLTIRDLMYPGRLTKNYNANKRKRYVPPIRLYLLSSLIFFIILNYSKVNKDMEEGFSDSVSTINAEPEDSTKYQDKDGIIKLSFTDLDERMDSLITSLNPFTYTSFDSLVNEEEKRGERHINFLEKRMMYNAFKWRRKEIQPNAYLKNMLANVSRSLFVLMPVFALLLKLFYWRRKKYYTEHLVFSLNLHTFIFLFFSIMILLEGIVFQSPLVHAFWAVPLTYLLLSLRVVYGGKLWGHILRCIPLLLFYSLLISLAVSLVIFITLFFGSE